jgi:hypothetical protein
MQGSDSWSRIYFSLNYLGAGALLGKKLDNCSIYQGIIRFSEIL